MKFPSTPIIDDLLKLIKEPSLGDRIHLKIQEAIINIMDGRKDQIAVFNKSLHGVAGFGMKDSIPVIVKADLSTSLIHLFQAPDHGLEMILNEIKNKNYHLLQS